MLNRGLLAAAALALSPGAAGCAQSLDKTLMDLAMGSAYQPPSGPALRAAVPPSRYLLLAGDFHCHVSPPDSDGHVSRGLDDTIELARRERLDFVVLTPHIRRRFFQEPALRERALGAHAYLRERLAREFTGPVLFVPGFEYTDGLYGHVGLSFGDLEGTLAALPPGEASEHPERFFEKYVASGGVLTVNHPFLEPVRSPFSFTGYDLSWRPFTSAEPLPPEIAAVDRAAQAYEAFNLNVAHLRDRLLLGDEDRSLEATLARLDREIPRRQKRMAPVGGSDSHSYYLRATTFVLAESKTARGVRDAVLAGRTCVRNPRACSLQVRGDEGGWRGVGGAVRARDSVAVRAAGETLRVLVDGRAAAAPASGEVAVVPVPPGRCAIVRAAVDEGFSAPIYVNCPFAEGG
ncbi:MAG TPA: hypothetical protein VFS43_40205 [Polyangiaceae bacterium]|nr:hypothetical protein [Polyangiaceae bacterium]